MEGAAIRPWWGRLDLTQIRVAAGETGGGNALRALAASSG